jgi:hypothetical protein
MSGTPEPFARFSALVQYSPAELGLHILPLMEDTHHLDYSAHIPEE